MTVTSVRWCIAVVTESRLPRDATYKPGSGTVAKIISQHDIHAGPWPHPSGGGSAAQERDRANRRRRDRAGGPGQHRSPAQRQPQQRIFAVRLVVEGAVRTGVGGLVARLEQVSA